MCRRSRIVCWNRNRGRLLRSGRASCTAIWRTYLPSHSKYSMEETISEDVLFVTSPHRVCITLCRGESDEKKPLPNTEQGEWTFFEGRSHKVCRQPNLKGSRPLTREVFLCECMWTCRRARAISVWPASQAQRSGAHKAVCHEEEGARAHGRTHAFQGEPWRKDTSRTDARRFSS